MNTLPLAALCLLATVATQAKPTDREAQAERIARGVEQLRHAHGEWSVTTEFLGDDGSVAASFEGTYAFRWVVEDRVLAGENDTPGLGQKSAILFYVNVDKEILEMSSVGASGDLWVMTGPIDGEVRTTVPKRNADGTTTTLRFTRSAVEPNRFESRMEISSDEGETWKPGNHQVFVRRD